MDIGTLPETSKLDEFDSLDRPRSEILIFQNRNIFPLFHSGFTTG
jgi:hypothetical protein